MGRENDHIGGDSGILVLWPQDGLSASEGIGILMFTVHVSGLMDALYHE